MRIVELFAGIGACSTALKRIGIDVEIVDAVEIDKYAIASFNAIHGTNFEVQDITKYNKELKDIDLITHGSPCQDFSIAGKQAGGDIGSGTRSSLLYETLKIVGKIRPKYILWENVKNILSTKHKHNFDKYIETLDILGYNSYYQILNAKDYGIPQNRERVYTVSIRKDIDNNSFNFPNKEELKIRIKDILEESVDEKYCLKEKQIQNFIKNRNCNCNPSGKGINGQVCIDDIAPTLTTNKGEGIKILVKNATKKGYDIAINGDSINLTYPNSKTRRGRVGHQVSQTLMTSDRMGVIDTDSRIRKLTPLESWRLMGFSDKDFEKAKNIPTSNTQLYKQAGNSIVVNVLERIFINLFKESESNAK